MKILAVTGCPTGIAHTFMAEEALKRAAKKLGVEIKVETHGQAGIKNNITPEEIKEAAGIIIAADKNVNPERFNGCPVVEVSVSQGIKDAEKLIQVVIDGKAPIREGETKVSEDIGIETRQTIGKQIYKHLMNGVSHMLPFVVGGGILIAVSFLFGIYSANPNDPSYNKFAALLMTTGGYGFQLMVPVLSAYIASSIGERPAFVPGFVGGMMANVGGAGFLGGIVSGFIAGGIILLLKKLFAKLPKSLEGLKAIFLYPVLGMFFIAIIMNILTAPMGVVNEGMKSFLASFQNSNPVILGIIVGIMCAFDMGGPVNKAAYVTGTALLAQGNYYFMAGVSAACITPPFVISIATLLFKNRFSEDQRSAGLANIVLGATHITEGAIPFAAEKPIVVIPILMFACAISASLTYLFGVQVPAPHGGFLVLPVVTGGLKWIFSILVGSTVGGVLYGISRKGIKK
ncbi:PTS fructose transporter subunit IIC [Fusobacterium sp.]|uniref:PTS fructose transporter subunit IIC n=1 Tax=Fusobacterium sp. TaxID=68766 RepID=UPI002618148C|nr:PTS fructose transporter subunit IIBC [Fusobacterium sp.]